MYGGPEVRSTSDDLVVKLAILVVKLTIFVVKLTIFVVKLAILVAKFGDQNRQFDGQKSRIFFSWPDRYLILHRPDRCLAGHNNNTSK